MSMMAVGDLASTSDITARFPQRMLPLEHGVNAPKLPPGDGAASSSKIDAVAPATKAAKTRSSAAPKKGKTRKTKELVTPLEYAKRLQAKLAEDQANGKSPASHTLRGKRIYYFGGDMNYAGESTRGRMDYIMKHGGTLVPVYDPAQMTHIVTDASAPVLLRALGLRSLEEIPKHIPTVTWDWVLSVRRPSESGKETAANAEHGENAQTDYEIMHAAYKQRIDAGMSFRVNAARPKQGHATAAYRSNAAGAHHGPNRALDSGEISSISEFTEDRIDPKISGARGGEGGLRSLRPSPSAARQLPQVVHPSAGGAGPYTVAPRNGQDTQPPSGSNDPLAEFYAQARAERESDLLRSPSEDESDSASEPGAQKPPTRDAGREATVQRGFLCDAKGTGLPAPRCANQDVIDKLEELMELHKSKLSDEDRWRVFSYGKAIRALRSCPERIRSYEQAKAIKGVGDKTARKIMEILETGDLRRIYHERTDDVDVVNLFMGIYGVGRNIAYIWYSNGCRTLDDVKARKGGIKLTAAQEIGLRYYTDINSRMPRSEAAEIFEMIKPIALAIDPKLFIEIMGSYRRGKADCGDIDILITRPTDDGKTHQGVLLKLLRELHCQGIVTEDLCLPDDFDDLELVYRGLCRRDSKSPRRRIDFLTVPYTSRGAALLYYTGDDIFNRSLRLKANVMGYSLNQRGLYAGVVRDPCDRRQKLDDGERACLHARRGAHHVSPQGPSLRPRRRGRSSTS
ncbi:hypothetical protein WOLCODRAFT_132716 [Wolfiporia cocos MD-104 SS10]|uniref:DNA polymerase lambda n=1 Tax=Wolfiporia cocos (strain MD-104) TaxID=742152 RepID=A0A2H3JZE4_WOLCO|nr:hypothetical protein WOLCODRAFT_132716 [Wolfiporia cocos MD-104 SS10]